MGASEPGETYRFGDFELDVPAYQLRHQGRPVRIERQPMELLILLVRRHGQLLSREEIVDRLWGKDVFVDVETSVNTAIRKVRQALRDSAEAPVAVETVPGKGYRFSAPVVVAAAAADSVPSPAPGRFSRRAVGVGLALAVALVGALASWTWRNRPAEARRSRVTVAVLPFQNLTGDPERDYVADGLAEETIASFGRIDPEHVSVIGRTSTMAYKGTRKAVPEIGQELGADYLVEGSIRAEGARLFVTSRLVRVRDQTQVSSASYDREPTSVIALQRELSTAIAEQLRLRLPPERLDALARRHTRNAEAYDLYLRGRHSRDRLTPATNARALEYYERAIALDPDYALVWAAIATTLVAMPINSDVAPAQIADRAREAAARAVAAEPLLAEAHTAQGQVHFFLNWDWAAAEASFRRAIALDPGFSLSHRMLGHVLSQTGRHREAIPMTRRAREVEPLYAMNHAIESQVAFQARDFPAAVEHARQAIVVDPEFWVGYIMLGQASEQTGESDRALAALMSAARYSDGNSKALSFRGHLLAKLGRTTEAREILRTLEGLSRERYVPPYAFALVHSGLGERDAALAALERAYEARDVHLVFLPVDPKWDAYRAHPRFRALVARCGFAARAP